MTYPRLVNIEVDTKLTKMLNWISRFSAPVNMEYIKVVENALASKHISQEAATNLILWLTDLQFKDFVPAVEGLLDSGDWSEIEDAFYTRITVGTGGIRGPLGVGPNRINLRTIGEAAQGLSQFIKDF